MLPKSFEEHAQALLTLQETLEAAGFDPSVRQVPAYLVPEIPLPALLMQGDFLGLDLGTQTANFPHRLSQPIHDAYIALHRNMQRQRAAAVGRPIVSIWDDIASPVRTGIRAILSPMRCGMYGVPRPNVAHAYHCAEFAYLASRVDDDAALRVDPENGDFFTELNGAIYGVLAGKYIDAQGDEHTPGTDFDASKLLVLRPLAGTMMPQSQKLWTTVYSFVLERGLQDDPELMQLLAHCRWALPQNLQWGALSTERRRPGRPSLVIEPSEAAARIEAACRHLEEYPHISVRHIKTMLVPSIIDPDLWREDITPFFTARRRIYVGKRKLLDYLTQMKQGIAL